jgi:uncharacterized protein YlxW (UPF0749 family)
VFHRFVILGVYTGRNQSNLALISPKKEVRMKKTPAIIAAILMTVLVGVLMLTVGGSAVFSVPTVSARNNGAAAATGAAVQDANVQIAQLQARIAEYQSREQQWQQRLSQSQDQVNQVTAQLQKYQQLVGSLQQMGVITIDPNGQVSVSRGGFSRDHDDN